MATLPWASLFIWLLRCWRHSVPIERRCPTSLNEPLLYYCLLAQPGQNMYTTGQESNCADGIIAELFNDCEETMAESTKEVEARRPKPKTAGTPATVTKEVTKATPKAETATGAPEAKPRFGFFSSLGGRAGGATGGTAANAGKPSMGRFFFGMSLYMVLALAAQFALSFIFQRLPASYSTQPLFTVPLLGSVTTYLLVWMLTLIVILYGLYKFNVLPRTLSQPRTSAAQAKADPKAKAAPTTKVKPTPVDGPNDDAYARVKARIRSERRKARRN
jgi:hypothetical protein